MKVAVYTIARNEAKQVAAYVDSCRGTDLVVVADTSLLRQAEVGVHDIAVKP